MSSGYTSTSVYASPSSASSPTCGPFPCAITSSCSSAIGASAAHAVRTLVRWFSAVSGSPRRSSAFPPRATTTRTSALQRRDEDGLDRVHPVLGLVEDERSIRLEHLVGDLERLESVLVEDLLADLRVRAVERRQAVHELDVRVARQRHRLAVDLVGEEQVDALGPHGIGLAHRD